MPNNTGNKIHHRHRTYTLAFKQQVIRETLEPGTSVSMVARRHDINANVVFTWRSQYRSGKLALPGPRSSKRLRRRTLGCCRSL
jgi:transposase